MFNKKLYIPVSSSLEEDELLPRNEFRAPSTQFKFFYGHRGTSAFKRNWYYYLNGLLVVLNLIFFLFMMLHISISRNSCPGLIYSPAADAVEYEVRTFNTSLFVKNTYNGYPNDQNNRAWAMLNSHQNIVVSKEELIKLNRTSVEIPGQGYLVTLGVFHELHCLNYIRQRLYPEIFNQTEDVHTVRLHVAHCLDNLRQAIQCHGDTSVLTYSWRPDYRNPWPDFQIRHECRKIDKLMQWSDLRKPNITNNTFIHSRLGNTPLVKSTVPTSFENATELVGGTRLQGIETQPDY